MDNYITRSEHNEFVKRMEDEHKRINRRLSNHDKSTEQLQELVKTVGILAVNMENMLKEVQDQGKRLERFEDEPRQNAGIFKKSIINTIGGAIGTAVVLGIAILIYITTKG